MNSFGNSFRINIFGESHGNGLGVIIDGVPPGIGLSEEDLLHDIARRKPGAVGTTPRLEADMPELVSGVYNGFTSGAPLTILFRNGNVRSKDYESLKDVPRPGHADFTAWHKFNGFNDPRGGGHFSGRLTLALVAAGVVAKKIVKPISIQARVLEVGGVVNYEEILKEAVSKGDSLGGLVECIATQMPIGLGEPFFYSVESAIAHLVFSIPATKGIEFGSGFNAAKMWGSEHNDVFLDEKGKTKSNNSAGVNGGICNGNDLVFRVAIKPTSSISLAQDTFHMGKGEMQKLTIEGRHDACIALRVPVVLEAVTAIALADLMLMGDLK